jgi:hypothetical protein
MNCAVCGDELAPNGNYLYHYDGKVSHYYCDLGRQNRELEAENIRLRDLLDKKVGTSIRVELPEKANGYRCYVTCQREKDEERMATILAESIKMLC